MPFNEEKVSMIKCCRIAVWLLLLGSIADADDEAANRPVVRSSQYGALYAKSVPAESYGEKGKTMIFAVGRESDKLICEYDWFADEIHLGGAGDETLIRFGPWPRGSKPQESHLAIGIYRKGKLVKQYSTVEIEKRGGGVSESVSHYQVFGERMGFRWLTGSTFVYEVKGVSGKVFTFDLETGNILEMGTEPAPGGGAKPTPQP